MIETMRTDCHSGPYGSGINLSDVTVLPERASDGFVNVVRRHPCGRCCNAQQRANVNTTEGDRTDRLLIATGGGTLVSVGGCHCVGP